MALCWTLDKLGPLGLTADDCGLVLEAIAGADPQDPTTTTQPYVYEIDASVKKFRLGVLTGVTDDVEAAVRSNFQQAIEVLQEVADIEEVTFPDLPYEEITRTILFAEASSAFEELIDSGRIAELTAPEDHYNPYVRTAILARDYLRALRLRGIMARQIDAILCRYDALVAPSRATTATPIEAEFRSAIRGSAKDIMGAVGNGAGLPGISVPNGFSEQGLPTGMQFMGRAYAENTVLAVARTYQSLTTWHTQHPADVLPGV
jgi:aspartyl-tRNA(Asn)/glutamyl-tRNA(Gln) amidotransferase subunit A